MRYLYLVHGTFAGTDALGLFGEIARFFPEAGRALRSLEKQAFDRLIGDTGNYTDEYAQQLAAGLNRRTNCPGEQDRPPGTAIEVRRFVWSSENHHLARGDAAVRLLDELLRLELAAGERVLVWSHSHAGNALALVTNLLAADSSTRRRFFHAARSYYRWRLLQMVDLPVWPRVRALLERGDHPLQAAPLDIVTLGAPVRYGWDTGGYGRLMHVVHHHPRPGLPPYQAAFPPTTEELLTGHGDFIQQVGIAGTDFPPWPIVWRSWLANLRLGRLLAPNLRRSGLLARLRVGQRVHDEGATLMVDYGPQEGTPANHFFGHAVYTRAAWMAFHAQQTARVLYNDLVPSTQEQPI